MSDAIAVQRTTTARVDALVLLLRKRDLCGRLFCEQYRRFMRRILNLESLTIEQMESSRPALGRAIERHIAQLRTEHDAATRETIEVPNEFRGLVESGLPYTKVTFGGDWYLYRDNDN